MKKGDVIRFAKNPPKSPYDTGIFWFEYGLVISHDESLNRTTVLTKDGILQVNSEWCTLAEEQEYKFIDDLIKRSKK